ncbi:hypothetical protein RDWZM_005413 [Blomia tropicalis]|uniref:AF-9 ANC1 homology domain-containing protein n=1 Tax=Blomia tropicalis TaxID=40697 RepID=A0A9Q0M590_BLOTA|nr:hypothetical protein RDWZM_005413 [Blomia tropicalis]
MFISHQHQIVHHHHNIGKDQERANTKTESIQFGSKPFASARSLSSKFVPVQSGTSTNARCFTGKSVHQSPQQPFQQKQQQDIHSANLNNQHQTTATTTTIGKFTPVGFGRPIGSVSSVNGGGTNSVRVGNQHLAVNGRQTSINPKFIGDNFAGTSITPTTTATFESTTNAIDNNNNNGNNSSAINKNCPAVKFLFKKPQLPATISSSSALYHFNCNSNQSNNNSSTVSTGNNNNNNHTTTVSKNGNVAISNNVPNQSDLKSSPEKLSTNWSTSSSLYNSVKNVGSNRSNGSQSRLAGNNNARTSVPSPVSYNGHHSLTFSKHNYQHQQHYYANQSKTKGANNKSSKSGSKSSNSSASTTTTTNTTTNTTSSSSSFSGAKESIIQQNVFKASGKSVRSGTSSSPKVSKHSQPFTNNNASDQQHGTGNSNNRSSFSTKDSKESQDRFQFAKKDTVTVKSSLLAKSSSRVNSSKKSSQQDKKSKTTTDAEFSESSNSSELFASNVDNVKKSKSRNKSIEKSRDRSTSKSRRQKVSKVESDNENSSTNKKHKSSKSKEKEKSTKEKKRKRKEAISSDESNSDSDQSDQESSENGPFVKNKLKRKREHRSGSSESSPIGAIEEPNESFKSSSDNNASFQYHPQAAASMAKAAMLQDPFCRTHPGTFSTAERARQKMLTDSLAGHFPAILQNVTTATKVTHLPSNAMLSSAATSFSAIGIRSPNVTSPTLSASSSPSQKVISCSKTGTPLHEDNAASDALICLKENAETAKMLSHLSKDLLNNTLGAETSQMLSTKIRYRDNKCSATIEIKSVNKEKNWEGSNEMKKQITTKESSKSTSSSTKMLSADSSAKQANVNANVMNESNVNHSEFCKSSDSTRSSKKSSTTSSTTATSEKSFTDRKSSKKFKSTQEDGIPPKKGKQTRDHSPMSLIDEKMPPPVAYIPSGAHSNKQQSNLYCNDSILFGDVNNNRSGNGNRLLQQQQQQTLTNLKECSTDGSHLDLFPSNNNNNRKNISTMEKGNKKSSSILANTAGGDLFQTRQSGANIKSTTMYSHSTRKLKQHSSDCDNDDDDDDKMSTVSVSSSMSTSSAASRISSSSSLSSIGSSLHSSPNHSSKKHQYQPKPAHSSSSTSTNKKTIVNEYSKKNHHHLKQSIKHINSIKKSSKYQTKNKDFDRFHSDSKAKKGSTKSKSKKQHRVQSDNGDQINSQSDADSDSSNSDQSSSSDDSDDGDNDNGHKSNGDLSNDSDNDIRNKCHSVKKSSKKIPKNNKNNNTTKTFKTKFETKATPSPPVRVKKVSKGSSNKGQSLLTPLSDLKLSSSSPIGRGSGNQNRNKYGKTNKRTTGGFTGLSDSDSSMDEDDDNLQSKTTNTFANNDTLTDKKRKSRVRHNSNSQSSDSSSSSDNSDVEAAEEEENEEKPRVSSRNDIFGISPQSTPNRSNYSKGNNGQQRTESPFERTNQNHSSSGYGTERLNSLSPPIYSFNDGGSGRANSFSFNELRDIQNRISHMPDSDLLQRVIDLIEERNSQCFNIVNGCLQFDLLKLDQSTLIEIKRIVI